MTEKVLEAKEAVELTIELWEWCAETGKHKIEWPKLTINGGEYNPSNACFLCEHNNQEDKGACEYCPYHIKFGSCMSPKGPYAHWAGVATTRARKKYAKLCLEQLREILQDLEKEEE